MKYGSVCSGIEAASCAWHPLGWRAAWLAEIEPFPAAVLAHHYPDIPNLGDMTKLPKLVLTGKIAAPDVLVGGTPCQAFSVAGMREGLNDPRGQLTIKFVELADAIDHVRVARGDDPAVIVWENVPGVLSDKGNAFGCFLGALAGESCELQPPGGKWKDAGCVFGPQRAIAWRILDAQYFGLAQRRRRVFVVASARNGFDPAQVLFEFDGLRRDTAPSRDKGASVAALTANGVGTCGADDNQGQAGHLIPAEGCWWDGGQVSQTLDAVLAKGQTMPEKNRFPAVLQPVAFHPTQDPISSTDGSTHAMGCGSSGGQASVAIAYPLLEVGKRTGASTTDTRAGMGVGSDVDPMFTLQAGAQHGVAVAFAENSRAEVRLENGDGQISGALSTGGGKPGQGTPCVAVAFQPGNLARGGGAEPSEEVFPTLRSDSGRSFGDQSPHVAYSVALRGRDGGAMAELGDEVQNCLRSSGGGGDKAHVLAPVCATGEVTHTLKADGFDGSEDGTGRGQPIVTHYQEGQYGIAEYPTSGTIRAGRIPEHEMVLNHTEMAVRRLTPRECERLQGFPDDWTLVPVRGKPAADGPRYKAIGNSMAVPVMAFIGRRIQMIFERSDAA